MRGQVGMISSSFSGTCLLLHHTVADEITHVVKTWASCVLKQLLKSKFGPENICRNSAGYANPISQRSIQWPSFLCIMVCADFPLLPKVSHKGCFHTQPLTHFVSPNFVPTNIDPNHRAYKTTPANMRCPYPFLEASTLRPWPVSFAVPGSLVSSSVGKLLVLHSGSSGGAPQCGLHTQSSTSEAFTGRRPWPVFQPAASQPTPFIRGSSPQNGSPSSHLDPTANGQ